MTCATYVFPLDESSRLESLTCTTVSCVPLVLPFSGKCPVLTSVLRRRGHFHCCVTMHSGLSHTVKVCSSHICRNRRISLTCACVIACHWGWQKASASFKEPKRLALDASYRGRVLAILPYKRSYNSKCGAPDARYMQSNVGDRIGKKQRGEVSVMQYATRGSGVRRCGLSPTQYDMRVSSDSSSWNRIRSTTGMTNYSGRSPD